MARTVIEESGTSPTYVEDTGPGVGMVLGILLGIALVVLLVLFFAGAFNNDTTNTPVPVPGNSAPAQPSSGTSYAP